MKFNEFYNWEAELEDGTVISQGSSLEKAVRFSLIPTIESLPRHDIVGIKMNCRFGRGFISAFGGSFKEYLNCVVCDTFRFYVKSSDGTVLITPVDFELYL